MSTADFIAVDWGTTNRRAYAIRRDGSVIDSVHDDRGVVAVPRGGFTAEIAALRADLGDLPILCAGMVGSTRGWMEVPYLPCPAGLDALGEALHWVDQRTAIVPGLSIVAHGHDDGGRGGVMRGEEVQLLGAVAAGLAPRDGLLCQPGTHCKWARMTGGAVAGFNTSMTGELFALLRTHGLLADVLNGAVADGPAFRSGVADAARGTLLGDLFGIRADVLLGLRKHEDAAPYCSGLLIGSDVREQALGAGATVGVIADAALGALYVAAITMAGATAAVTDDRAAFVAGITRLWRHKHDRQ